VAAKKVIDIKNEADQYIYNTEKQLQEHSARIPQNIKDQITGDISALNEAIVSEDIDKITEALDRLKNSSMEIGKSIYAQSDNDSSTTEEPQAEEADRTEESEEDKKKEEEKKEEEKK
jgi:molecular chaperone DnaK